MEYTVLLLLLSYIYFFDEIRRETRKLEQLWKFFFTQIFSYTHVCGMSGQNCVKDKNKKPYNGFVLFCFISFRANCHLTLYYTMATHTQTCSVFLQNTQARTHSHDACVQQHVYLRHNHRPQRR